MTHLDYCDYLTAVKFVEIRSRIGLHGRLGFAHAVDQTSGFGAVIYDKNHYYRRQKALLSPFYKKQTIMILHGMLIDRQTNVSSDKQAAKQSSRLLTGVDLRTKPSKRLLRMRSKAYERCQNSRSGRRGRVVEKVARFAAVVVERGAGARRSSRRLDVVLAKMGARNVVAGRRYDDRCAGQTGARDPDKRGRFTRAALITKAISDHVNDPRATIIYAKEGLKWVVQKSLTTHVEHSKNKTESLISQ
uniref:Uncharacterized protein n=1 Tax=Romanomermis culicivorax TaxID=13658 RepID=A0A915JK44_ROMCU